MQSEFQTAAHGVRHDRLVGEGVKFERIRRITGYLVGTMERWNDAKRAEEKDRVKHMGGGAAGTA